MRNSLNAQVFAFRHPDFLVMSATHATAHLALLDQAMWDKYQPANIPPCGKFERNTFVIGQKGRLGRRQGRGDPMARSRLTTTRFPALRRRGAVFHGLSTSSPVADVSTNRLTPFLVGVGLGVLGWIAFAVARKPLGITTALSRVG